MSVHGFTAEGGGSVARGQEVSGGVANPDAGARKIYPKADGWYELDAAGIESRLSCSTQTVFAQTSDATVGDDIDELPIISAGVGSTFFPANYLREGRSLRMRLRGHVSQMGGGTGRVRFYLDSTPVLDSGEFSFTGGPDQVEVEIEGFICCRSTGVGGSVMCQGHVNYDGGATVGMVNTSPTPVDTTMELPLTVTFEWSVGAAANTITITNATCEVLL